MHVTVSPQMQIHREEATNDRRVTSGARDNTLTRMQINTIRVISRVEVYRACYCTDVAAQTYNAFHVPYPQSKSSLRR